MSGLENFLSQFESSGNSNSIIENLDEDTLIPENVEDTEKIHREAESQVRNIKLSFNIIKESPKKEPEEIKEDYELEYENLEIEKETQQAIPGKIKSQKEVPIDEEINQTKKQEKIELTESELAEKRFIESETSNSFREVWFEFYQKGLSSKKNTITSRKVKAGRFKVNKDGNIELLPDIVTYNVPVSELLKQTWFKNEE